LKIKDTIIPLKPLQKKYYLLKRAASFWLCFSHSIEEELKLIIEQLKKTSPRRPFCYAYQIGTEIVSYRQMMTESQATAQECPITVNYYPVTNTIVIVVRFLRGQNHGGGLYPHIERRLKLP
jgi:hypothetical protein